MIIRFYKNEIKRIKKAAKKSRTSMAAVVRFAVNETFINYETD